MLEHCKEERYISVHKISKRNVDKTKILVQLPINILLGHGAVHNSSEGNQRLTVAVQTTCIVSVQRSYS